MSVHCKRSQCTFFACTRTATYRCKKCFHDLCPPCFIDTHSNSKLPQFISHRPYVRKLKQDMNRNDQEVENDVLDLIQSEGRERIDRVCENLDCALKLLNDILLKATMMRADPMANVYVSIGSMVTSLCHDRCEKLVEREMAHLNKLKRNVEGHVGALRNRIYDVHSIKQAMSAYTDDLLLGNALANNTLNAKFISDYLSNLDKIERDVEMLQNFYAQYNKRLQVDCTRLRSSITEFFDEEERKLDAFYQMPMPFAPKDELTVPAAANSSVSAGENVAVGANAARSDFSLLSGMSSTRKDDSKRKTCNLANAIVAATPGPMQKNGAKKCRKTTIAASAQFATIREEVAKPTSASDKSLSEIDKKQVSSDNLPASESKHDDVVTANDEQLVSDTQQQNTSGEIESSESESSSEGSVAMAGCANFGLRIEPDCSDTEMLCSMEVKSVVCANGYCEPSPPSAGDAFECYLVHFETLDEFYVVRRADYDSNTAQIGDAVKHLVATVQSNPNPPTDSSDDLKVVVGGMYVARYEDDGSWYRATVTCVDETARIATVRFVDFGNERKVRFTHGADPNRKLIRIDRHCTSPYILRPPAQALRCSLAGVKLATAPAASSAPPSPAFGGAFNRPKVESACEAMYWKLLDVLLVARVINVRRLYTVGTGGFLPPTCIGNPYVCDVLLCFAENLDGEKVRPIGDSDLIDLSEVSNEVLIKHSVQCRFVQNEPPLLAYTTTASDLFALLNRKQQVETAATTAGPSVTQTSVAATASSAGSNSAAITKKQPQPQVLNDTNQADAAPVELQPERKIIRGRVAEPKPKRVTGIEPSPFGFGVQAGRSAPNKNKSSAAATVAGKAYSVQMEAPVYVTCVEAPNSIYIVHRRNETERQLLAMHAQLERIVKTDRALDVMQESESNDIERARTYLLETFRAEFDALHHSEQLSDVDLTKRWLPNAACWTSLAIPCIWQPVRRFSALETATPRWLRGLLVEVDFDKNLISIVSIDYGGTARMPLVPASLPVGLTTKSPSSVSPVWNRLFRLAPQLSLVQIPPFATCVALADLVSAGMLLPLGTTMSGPLDHPMMISDESQLTAAYTKHIGMAWVTKAVEAFGHALFLNPDWDPAELHFGDHLPTIVHPDGSFEDVYEKAATGQLQRSGRSTLASRSAKNGCDSDAKSVHLIVDDEFEIRRKLEEKVRSDVLAQNAVYLRVPSDSVFTGFPDYDLVKQDLARWLQAGFAAPLPLDGCTRVQFRWPKAGVHLFIRQRRTTTQAAASSSASASASSDKGADYINLGDILVRTGVAFKLAFAHC